jgi:hypothetical protein
VTLKFGGFRCPEKSVREAGEAIGCSSVFLTKLRLVSGVRLRLVDSCSVSFTCRGCRLGEEWPGARDGRFTGVSSSISNGSSSPKSFAMMEGLSFGDVLLEERSRLSLAGVRVADASRLPTRNL